MPGLFPKSRGNPAVSHEYPPILSQEELGCAMQKLRALATAMNQVLFGQRISLNWFSLAYWLAGISCWRACPAWARRNWSKASPGHWISQRAASSSHPIYCRETSREPRFFRKGTEQKTSSSRKGPSSPTSCWRMKSTAPPPRPSPPCWKPCRNAASPSWERPMPSPPPFRACHPEPH